MATRPTPVSSTRWGLSRATFGSSSRSRSSRSARACSPWPPRRHTRAPSSQSSPMMSSRQTRTATTCSTSSTTTSSARRARRRMSSATTKCTTFRRGNPSRGFTRPRIWCPRSTRPTSRRSFAGPSQRTCAGTFRPSGSTTSSTSRTASRLTTCRTANSTCSSVWTRHPTPSRSWGSPPSSTTASTWSRARSTLPKPVASCTSWARPRSVSRTRSSSNSHGVCAPPLGSNSAPLRLNFVPLGSNSALRAVRRSISAC